jgi:hypothetical protein
MGPTESVVAVFQTHSEAEDAVRKLAQSGFDMKSLSVIGRGYHIDEKVIGFYNLSDRVAFWGTRGAFWGGLWGLFTGGILITVPTIGAVAALGYLATSIIAGIESAVVVGAMSALSAALFSIGIPQDSVLEYETAIAADKFLVMAHGSAAELGIARSVLAYAAPSEFKQQASDKSLKPEMRPSPVHA